MKHFINQLLISIQVFLVRSGWRWIKINYIQVFVSTRFWVYFKFPVIMVKIVINSITTMKRYCEATLNAFLYKKNFDDAKGFYSYDRFFMSNQNFITKILKTVLNIRFVLICQIPGFFSLICQIPCFSGTPGLLTTLKNKKNSKLKLIVYFRNNTYVDVNGTVYKRIIDRIY